MNLTHSNMAVAHLGHSASLVQFLPAQGHMITEDCVSGSFVKFFAVCSPLVGSQPGAIRETIRAAPPPHRHRHHGCHGL